MIKFEPYFCPKCGMRIKLPDYDEAKPFYQYYPEMSRVILKHGWQHHRQDFPPQFKSFAQFMSWIRSPQSRVWKGKCALLAEAQRAVQGQIEALYWME